MQIRLLIQFLFTNHFGLFDSLKAFSNRKIFWLTGGIGNQLFILAASFNVRSESKVYFDLGNYKFDFREFKLDKLGFQIRKANFISLLFFRPKFQKIFLCLIPKFYKPVLVNEENSVSSVDIFNGSRMMYFQGYWQQTICYKNVLDLMRLHYNLPNKYKNDCYRRIIEKVKISISVAVHVRRADYMTEENSKTFNILDADYYNCCISLMVEKIKCPQFFVFSEDVNWVKENLNFGKNAVVFVTELLNVDYLEFDIMRQCNHAIIANSTFSWWAAELNKNSDKIIFAPKKYFTDIVLQEKYANGQFLFNPSFQYL